MVTSSKKTDSRSSRDAKESLQRQVLSPQFVWRTWQCTCVFATNMQRCALFLASFRLQKTHPFVARGSFFPDGGIVRHLALSGSTTRCYGRKSAAKWFFESDCREMFRYKIVEETMSRHCVPELFNKRSGIHRFSIWPKLRQKSNSMCLINFNKESITGILRILPVNFAKLISS